MRSSKGIARRHRPRRRRAANPRIKSGKELLNTIAFESRTGYIAAMTRGFSASIAILLCLAPAIALGAHAHKRHVRHWHGYGFLPGYRQPIDNRVPIFGEKGAIRDTDGVAPMYWYDGDWYYFGRPRFYRGRYNGGSFGPCWTWTPIGPMWNCG
jgi:hypothetical protein